MACGHGTITIVEEPLHFIESTPVVVFSNGVLSLKDMRLINFCYQPRFSFFYLAILP